ncbi:esterase-like activity of phytase family protein [Pseudovibrio sp. POLY-S9]|uniref:esterase-like activity of phytase family protein n=1 Tax=Pseudovibrio sp. POLY-S9 TaxID=1576596 RepID=UPI00070CF897|nr:esterase-like activity of phytase family protein [Pseudovibrio sp. POLY-S9]
MKLTRRILLTGAAAAVTTAVAASLPFSESTAQQSGFQPMKVRSKEINRFKFSGTRAEQYGPLMFLGGLELSSSNGRFGGYSGLLTLNSGSDIIAVSDRGHWLRGELSQTSRGKPLKLLGAETATLLDSKGRNLKRTYRADTEGLSIGGSANTPRIFVSHEGKGGIMTYPLNLKTGEERAKHLLIPKEIRGLAKNKSLESVAVAPPNSPLSGAIITIAERGKSLKHNRPAWIIGGPRPGKFWIGKQGNYDVTDAAFLPNGDLLILERLFNLSEGLGMRIRQLDGSNLRPDHLHTGKTLLTADFSYQIDNMEALSVHMNAFGETVLSLMSDDNRSFLQRTLLLRFILTDNEPFREPFVRAPKEAKIVPAPKPKPR